MKPALVLLSAVAALTLSAAGSLSPCSAPAMSRMLVDRLPGTWGLDPVLTRALEPDRELIGMKKLAFVEDVKVLDDKRIASKFAKQELLQGGWMWLNGDGPYPYVLSTQARVAHVTWFRPAGRDQLGEAFALRLWITPARDRMDDLLFLGRESSWAWGVGYARSD